MDIVIEDTRDDRGHENGDTEQSKKPEELHDIKQIITKSHEKDIDYILKSRRMWQKIATAIDAIGQLFVCIAGVLTFSSGWFDKQILAYTASLCFVVAVSLFQYKAHAKRKAQDKTKEINKILEYLNIKQIPEFITIDNNKYETKTRVTRRRKTR